MVSIIFAKYYNRCENKYFKKQKQEEELKESEMISESGNDADLNILNLSSKIDEMNQETNNNLKDDIPKVPAIKN